LPTFLSNKDKKKQSAMLKKSQRQYKKGIYETRKKVESFHSKKSSHIINAQRLYGVDKILPNEELSRATGCSVGALQKIVRKGEGAYYSSGSRPNQTARSWGLARLAGVITGSKAAAVDYKIVEEGCKKSGRAYKRATTAKNKYGNGLGRTRKVIFSSA
jgi:hypothetical protein